MQRRQHSLRGRPVPLAQIRDIQFRCSDARVMLMQTDQVPLGSGDCHIKTIQDCEHSTRETYSVDLHWHAKLLTASDVCEPKTSCTDCTLYPYLGPSVTGCYIKLVDIVSRGLLPSPLHLLSDTRTCHYVIARWTAIVGVASGIMCKLT